MLALSLAAAAAIPAPPADAATTFTPTGGPEVHFAGSNVSFTAQPSGQTMTCEQFDGAGELVDPGVSRPYGATMKSSADLIADGCTNPIAGEVSVTPLGVWVVTITGDEVSSGVWPGRIENVHATVSAADCSFDVAGTIDGTFDETTQRVEPAAEQSGLVVSTDPVGAICPLFDIYKGDPIEVGGYWTNQVPTGSAPIDISSP